MTAAMYTPVSQRAHHRPAPTPIVVITQVLTFAALTHCTESRSADSAQEPPIGTTQQAQLPKDAKRYRPPQGFGGHTWGSALPEFSGFIPDPVQVQTAYSRGKVTSWDMDCVPSSNPLVSCDLEKTLRTYRERREGEGWHALAEYQVDQQGFQIRGTAAIFFPVYWQFCATKWGGTSGALPQDIQQGLQLCGVRLLFHGETIEELQQINDDEYVTAYEHVLRHLIALHGEPGGYGKRGHTIITTPNERIVAPRKRRFREWRWCRVRGSDLSPSCSASIVLAFDPQSGWGVVLFATQAVWEFAYARHNGGAENDPLYKLLHGLEKYSPADHACTGTYLCRPPPPQPMSQQTLEKFRIAPSSETSQ